MTTGLARRPRGAALATAMLLTVLLLTLGMSFLTFCQRDLQFQRRQQDNREAQNLARAGVEYFRYLDTKDPPQSPPAGSKKTVQVVAGLEEFEIERTTANTFISRGRVKRSDGRLSAERTIVVPNGNLRATNGRVYDRDL